VTDASSSSGDAGAVFTGDTLFIGGCGVFFEGTGADMHAAFELLRAALPDDTVTYVGHEYTAGNLRFARSVDPGNAGLARLAAIIDAHPVTVGRTMIGDEKEWNVFWHLTSDAVRYVFCSFLSTEKMDTFSLLVLLVLRRTGLLRRRGWTHHRAK